MDLNVSQKRQLYNSLNKRHISGEVHVPGRVLILAGGGGHTGYGYALAEAIHGKVSLSFLVPEEDSLSAKRLSKFGKVDFLIKPRDPKTPLPIFMARLFRAFMETFSYPINEFDAVVSTGSNFCVPPAIVAWTRGIPVINIESPVRFVKPSKSALVLQPFSKTTALHWKEQKRFLDGTVVGPILPKPVVESRNEGYILVAGGTHGHRLLFNALAESNLSDVVLQTGRVDPTPYIKKHPEWKAFTIAENFHEFLAGAELVVTHLGVTVLEAVMYKKPVVLVPNPEWTRTGTVEDAKYLAKKINAVFVSEIKQEVLLNGIEEARRRTVPTLPNGAENLANMIIKMLREKKN